MSGTVPFPRASIENDHVPQWSISLNLSDERYNVWVCQYPACFKEQWQRKGEQSFPNLSDHHQPEFQRQE